MPPPLFVQLVDGATTVTKLIKQILDLVSEVLVVTLDNIELLHSLIIASLKAEDLGAVVPSFAPAGLQLGHQVVSLCLPFSHHLVEVLSPLLGDDCGGVGALILHLQILKLNLNAMLGLLGGSNLGVEGVDCLLGFINASAKLRLVALELVNATKCLSLELGFPQLDLSLSLGEGTQGVVLALSLLFDSHLHVLAVSCQVLVLGQKRGTVASLSISKLLGVLKLGGEGHLALAKCGNRILSLLNLARQVLRLNDQLLLCGISLIESTGKLIHLGWPPRWIPESSCSSFQCWRDPSWHHQVRHGSRPDPSPCWPCLSQPQPCSCSTHRSAHPSQ